MTDKFNHDDVSRESDTVELVLVDSVVNQLVAQDEPGVTNSERIYWLEQAYRLLRDKLLLEAPECISITFGFPSTGARKTKNQRLGEYAHSFMQGYPDHLAYSGFISLHPTIFNNPSRVLDVRKYVCPDCGQSFEQRQMNSTHSVAIARSNMCR